MIYDQIEKYHVVLGSAFKGTQAESRITLYGANEAMLGVINFYGNKDEMPKQDVQNEMGIIQAAYHIEDFSRVLDLLRNEKPLCIYFDPSASKPCLYLTSAKEGVGEGDAQEESKETPERMM